MPTTLDSLLSSLSGGGGNDLLTQILAPLLQIQQRGFGTQQQGLTDAFRAAGALRGGSYGVAMPRLLGDQGLAKSALIGQTSSSMLGPLLQALMEQQRLSQQNEQFYAGLNRSGSGGGGAFSGNLLSSPPAIPGAGTSGIMPNYSSQSSSPEPLNYEAILRSLMPSNSNSAWGGGFQGNTVSPGGGGNYGQLFTPASNATDPWAGIMTSQDWSNFAGA